MNESEQQDKSGNGQSTLGPMLLRMAVVLACVGAIVFALFLNEKWPTEFDVVRVGLAATTAFPLMLGSMLIAGWRLAILAGKPVSPWDGIAVNVVSQFVVLLIPSRLSEAAKPIGLNLRCGLPIASGIAVLVVERLLDTIFLAFLTLSSVTIALGPYAGPLRTSAIALATIASVGLCGLVILVRHPRLLQRIAALTRSEWLSRQAEQMAGPLTRLADRHAAEWAIGLTALSWLLSYLIFLAVIRIIGLGDLTAGAILVVFVASTLGLVISVAPGGLGTFEGAIVLALNTFNVPLATAVATALLIRLSLILPIVFAAGWFLYAGRDTLSTLIRRLRKSGRMR